MKHRASEVQILSLALTSLIMIKYCDKHGEVKHYVRQRKDRNKPTIECSKCVLEYRNQRRRRNKLVLVKEFGGKCSICGYNKSLAALHFHHLDKNTKTKGIAEFRNKSIIHMRKEAQKCVLLCANCHFELEYASFD